MSEEQGSDPKKPRSASSTEPAEQPFDALGAAAELAAAMGDDATQNTEAMDDMDATLADGGPGPGLDFAGMLEKEVEELQQLLAAKDKELLEAHKDADRARTEITAAQQRISREAKQDAERRSKKVLGGFIEVLDDLDRAIASALESDHNPAVVEGVQLVQSKFLSKLREFGVEKRPCQGEIFDPAWHDAVGTAPVEKDEDVNRIIHVVLDAYAMGDEPLREARVVVGKLGE